MTRFPEPIYVTRPLLPPLDEMTAALRGVWQARQLTNWGALHNQLEDALRRQLGTAYLSLFNNGTIALLTAIRALGLKGSVITTPFTFPATVHALAWSGIEPVFCDIDPHSMTIAPAAAEAAVRPDTTGILGVHVYGLPCDVHGLGDLARRRGLKLVYDGAHAFGTRLNGVDIARYGDTTMFSFHATKLFHTAEGGALACQDASLRLAFDRLKNFGIANQNEVPDVGINGKMNELQAALGLAVLRRVPEEVERRRAITSRYAQNLAGIPGLRPVTCPPGVESSFQYCVIRVEPDVFGCSRDDIYRELQKYNVFTRKYFHPLCSTYAAYRDLPSAGPENLPVASRVVGEVLCLPIYGDLPLDAVDRICEMLVSVRTTSASR